MSVKWEWCQYGNGPHVGDVYNGSKNPKRFRCAKCKRRFLPRFIRDEFDSDYGYLVIPPHKRRVTHA